GARDCGGAGGHGTPAGCGGPHPDRHDHRSGAHRVAGDLHVGHRDHLALREPVQVEATDRTGGRAPSVRSVGPPRMPRSGGRLPRIPEMTVRRLSVYLRCLAQLEEDGVKTISSQELAARFHLNSAQVRKDLAYFGEFGIRGIGYDTTNLRLEIQRILGLDREWRVVLVGFGNLGSALFHYRGFARQGFRIVAIVDDDPVKVGRTV